MYLGKKLSEGEAVDVPDFIPANLEYVSASTLQAIARSTDSAVLEENRIPVFED